MRCLCLARDVIKPGGHYRAPSRRSATALACEVKYARQFVRADDLDTADAAAFEPIGVSCRICARTDCHQRAAPGREGARGRPNRGEVVPYRIA